MAVLGPQQLLELVEKQGLVSNLAERELTNPEGAGFDIRIRRVMKIAGNAFLGVTERQTPTEEVLCEYKEGEKISYTISPEKFVLMDRIEEV